MGTFDPRITISHGLPPDMRHLKKRTRRGRKRWRRSLDDSYIVEVDDWPLPRGGTGALDYFAVSCNSCENEMDPRRWRRSTIDAIERRLNESDGLAKGRVIWAYGEDWIRNRTKVAVLAYHLPRAGVVEILTADSATDIWPERHHVFIAALVVCGHRIARECATGGSRSIVEWTASNRERAGEIARVYGFREVRRGRDGYTLASEIDYGAG